MYANPLALENGQHTIFLRRLPNINALKIVLRRFFRFVFFLLPFVLSCVFYKLRQSSSLAGFPSYMHKHT
uniref:Uncharacterized protein n=1 Tax=Anguilla anguilla TaxID=7936 RepID=A0A0E9QU46_ANGAN